MLQFLPNKEYSLMLITSLDRLQSNNILNELLNFLKVLIGPRLKLNKCTCTEQYASQLITFYIKITAGNIENIKCSRNCAEVCTVRDG